MKTKPNGSTEGLNKRKLLFEAKENAKKNDMLETAVTILKLHTHFDMAPKDIINELKKIDCIISLPHVYNHLKLAKVPAKIKSYIKTDKINPTDVLAVIHKHQSDSELIKIVDKIVSEKEKELNAQRQQQKVEKVKTIEQKILSFFKRQGITPNDKDRENLMRITGKYAI
jgi:glycyl-tRNA synthetase beta subunit